MAGFEFLDIFLGMLGFGLSIIFCTAFCRTCGRMREEQVQREVRRRREQEARPIYFIPFDRNPSLQDAEDPRGMDLPPTPTSGLPDYYGPPPSYNELGIKPDDLPPAYSEQILPAYSSTPSPHTDVEQTQAQPQP